MRIFSGHSIATFKKKQHLWYLSNMRLNESHRHQVFGCSIFVASNVPLLSDMLTCSDGPGNSISLTQSLAVTEGKRRESCWDSTSIEDDSMFTVFEWLRNCHLASHIKLSCQGVVPYTSLRDQYLTERSAKPSSFTMSGRNFRYFA